MPPLTVFLVPPPNPSRAGRKQLASACAHRPRISLTPHPHSHPTTGSAATGMSSGRRARSPAWSRVEWSQRQRPCQRPCS
eukprot:2042949-Pyramimonas_sp.AAC.1